MGPASACHWKRSSPIVRGNAIRNKADGDHEVSNSGEVINAQLTEQQTSMIQHVLSEPIFADNSCQG